MIMTCGPFCHGFVVVRTMKGERWRFVKAGGYLRMEMVCYLRWKKEQRKTIDNGRNKKVPSQVAGVVAEDFRLASPPLRRHGARFSKGPGRKLPPDAAFGGTRSYLCIGGKVWRGMEKGA